jgi:hypothetical protein
MKATSTLLILSWLVMAVYPIMAQTWAWERHPVHPPPGGSVSKSVVTDTLGNVWITGSFSGVANFDTIRFVSKGEDDVFVAKYGPCGELQWVKQFGGIGLDSAQALNLEPQGNIRLVGHFRGTSRFDSFSLRSAEGVGSMFLV